MVEEVRPARLGDSLDLIIPLNLNTLDLIGVALTESLDVSLNIRLCFDWVTRDFEGVTRRFRDSQSEIKSN